MNSLKRSCLFLFSLIFFHAYGVPLSHVDSLLLKVKEAKSDTEKVKNLLEVSTYYYNRRSANDTALSSAEQALEIAEKNNYSIGKALAYYSMGFYFGLKGDNEKTLVYYFKALDIFEKKGEKVSVANIYDQLSGFYFNSMQNNSKAMEYAQKGLEIREQLGDKDYIARSLNTIGNIYYNTNDSKNALKYYLQSLDILNKLGGKHLNDIATAENNIGSVYIDLKNYDKAIEYYQEALPIYQNMKNKYGIAVCFGNIGNAYNMKGEPEKGIPYSEQDLQIAREIHSNDNIAQAYTFLAEGDSAMGNYKKAFEYELALSSIKDTIFNEESSKQVNEDQVKYETVKKDKENKILELNINRQKIINYSVSAGLLLVIALVFFVYRSYVNKKKAHEELADKNKIIEEKNKDILDSITYAKRLQDAILPPLSLIKQYLPESFLLYKPKDIVAGDFYWMERAGDTILIAAADCTGHGVPGALVSVVCSNALNRALKEFHIIEPGKILDKVRDLVLETFEKSESNIQDGMDISLCCINTKTKEAQWSGAYNSLWYIQNHQIHEVAADKQPIGKHDNPIPFTTHNLKLQKGDILYLFTDGFADQFGGPKGRKFKYKQLEELLLASADKPMAQQKEPLNKEFENWKGSLEQVDDVLIMGVRV